MTEASNILIVEARYYEDIADELARGAIAELEAAGASYERAALPGTFEIVAAIRFAIDSGKYDGYIALGCVIRGETTHYDYICTESARGLTDLVIQQGIALGYGILTTEDREQAWRRAAVAELNKGADAAKACLTMVALKRRFRSSGPS
ncbi:MAG: 6,7-dimethyl-8-ribityllumazine synthase [Alphaproteobacteria bacterium]|nr:6,7-dimethyl-8-ribityllumazine synthase [Pseudomonadota bacterium]